MKPARSSATLLQTALLGGDSVRFVRPLRIASVAFIAALTAAAAQVSIPFTQVPFTLQPMVVLLGGMVLGARLGMTAQALYLAAGIAGLPVFAASVTLPPGALRLLGPTGGFLLAYPLAAFVTGYLAERGFGRRYATSVLAMLAGLTIVFACGVTWLALFASAGSGAAPGFQTALAAAFYPFVLADIAKVLFAAAVLPAMWRFTGYRPSTSKY